MLTSITPLGERGRGNRWRITAAWLVTGHLIGGLALGALLAVVGSSVALIAPGGFAGGAGAGAIIVVVAGLASAAVAFDLLGGRLPGRRQVDERWLTTYRGWVYGLGFGVQLGFGLVTVVNTALLGAVLVAGVLVEPGAAVALGGLYGGVRGFAAVASGRVRSVADLHRLHRLLDESERTVQRVSLALVATVVALAATSMVVG